MTDVTAVFNWAEERGITMSPEDMTSLTAALEAEKNRDED